MTYVASGVWRASRWGYKELCTGLFAFPWVGWVAQRKGGTAVYALGEGPVGDVVTAILQVDSRLKVIHRKIEASSSGEPPDELATAKGLAASSSRDALGDLDVTVLRSPEDARDLLDGYCTVVFVIVAWACAAREAAGDKPEDALSSVVHMLFARLRLLKKAVAPSAIPTMVALVTAATLGSSPQRWREQYGHVWSGADVAALEATTVCLAEWVNTLEGSPDAALRLIMDYYERDESAVADEE
ncbi:MAG: hypothetical protein JWM19_1776 [Actinomycetia bacterium]|nr:hypothetical protein [Actinomycetes bacterium]